MGATHVYNACSYYLGDDDSSKPSTCCSPENHNQDMGNELQQIDSKIDPVPKNRYDVLKTDSQTYEEPQKRKKLDPKTTTRFGTPLKVEPEVQKQQQEPPEPISEKPPVVTDNWGAGECA